MTNQSFQDVFGERVDLYDALIDWPRRLSHEEPFYRQWFQATGASRILDAACGTGRHAAMFHDWGLTVEGADISGAMVDYCRREHGESDRLRWMQRPFTRPADPPGTFDVVVCVGNSMALAEDMAAVAEAMKAMLLSVRPGGLCIVQVLNIWRFPEGPTIWQKHLRQRDGKHDRILLKGIHRTQAVAFIDFAEFRLASDAGIETRFYTSRILGFEAEELENLAFQAGFGAVHLFGGYREESYDRAKSTDIVLVAERSRR